MDRVFLDANVLFSAAYRPTSKLLELWRIKDIAVLTSAYAIEEARRNLQDAEQEALDRLIEMLTITSNAVDFDRLPVALPEKDRPILAGAIAARATHLLTGDQRHFGPYFHRRIGSVLVLTPADYLRRHRHQERPV